MIEIILLIVYSIFFFWLSWKRTATALVLIVLALPSYLVRFNIFFIPATLLEIMILLLFAAWFLRKIIIHEPKKIYFSEFRWPALLFLLSAVAAVFISPDTRAALGIFKAYFLEPLLFFFVFMNTVYSQKQVKTFLWALGVSSLFISFIALWQYLDLLPSFEPWISETPKRVTSLFDYPNAIGLFLAPIAVLFLGILLLAHPAKDEASKKLENKTKQFVIGVAVFSLLGIFFSFSRGAFLGALSGIIFFSFFSRFKKWIWATLILLILIALIIPPTRSVVLEIITLKDVSTDVRTVLWQGTWNLLKERSLQGAGLAGFPIIYDQYRLIKHTELLLYPHNIFLNFWTELGLGGLLIFLWLIILFFQKGFKLRKIDFQLKPLPPFSLSLVLVGTMISIIVYGLVDVPYFKNDLSVFFWLLIGLLVVLSKMSNQFSSHK